MCVCGDVGGANAVAPVIEGLIVEGKVCVEAFAYGQAIPLWQKRNLPFEAVGGPLEETTIDRMLDQPPASLLLTGTSYNPIGLEKQFTLGARRKGTPSIAVLDFWSNYGLRFSDAYSSLGYLPDQIAIMDDHARQEMIREGFDSDRLVITGHPAFDELVEIRKNHTATSRDDIRQELGVGAGSILVVFFSQPFSSFYDNASTQLDYPGYTEGSVLPALIDALDRITRSRRQSLTLAIRPHPKENIGALEEFEATDIRLVVVRHHESRPLAMAADLVSGMSSMLLVEACYLGCLVASIQPGLRVPDRLPTNRSGLSQGIYTEAAILPVLEEMLFDEAATKNLRANLSQFTISGGATRSVMSLVYRTIGLE